MARKPKNVTPPPPPSLHEWEPDSKEIWHSDFEKEIINDEKWSCIVTVAVQSEVSDEECILTYAQCVRKGGRKSVKIITMADIIKLLREYSGNKGKKENENPKTGKPDMRPRVSVYSPPPRRPSQIVELAAKYAVISDTDCQLPPDLMAGLLKHLILKLKEENCFQKRVEAVRERKLREQAIRAKFIREKKPFEKREEEIKEFTYSQSATEIEEPINDEPLGGPDLYIMLVDFYDVSYFPEMLRVNIPLVALVKISTNQGTDSYDNITPPKLMDAYLRKSACISNFWEKLKQECITSEKTTSFKDVAMMQYVAPAPRPNSKQYCRLVFDELSWMQYSAHCIYRQHQKYLQEMQVQPVFLSLERLDLSKCTVYNKLCDALVTGEPVTPLIVLYAMVEQVVAGVQDTDNLPLKYHPKPPQFVPRMRRRTSKKRRIKLSISSNSERKDSPGGLTDKHRDSSLRGSDGSINSLEPLDGGRGSCNTILDKLEEMSDIQITENLLDQVLKERKTEKESKADKKWKTPILCSHADSVFRQTFYCDPRLFDAEAVVRRFLGNSDFFQIWRKYPKHSPEESVYYNYHFYRLWKISKGREDLLKLKIFFCLAMKLIGITKSYLYRGDEENVSASISEQAKEKPKFASKPKLERNPFPSFRGEMDSFSNYFFKTFIVEMYSGVPRKAVADIQNKDWAGSSFKTDSQLLLMKITSHLNVFLMSRRSSRASMPNWNKLQMNKSKSLHSQTKQEKAWQTLSFLLECMEISNLTEAHFGSENEDYINIIKSYKFYERLESNLMIQRMLEAGENFNTIQCWHFVPTDTLVIIMHDDFDHRRVFHSSSYGTLPTPVALRDFYNYVYPEISDWLVSENAEHWKFVTGLAEKLKEQEEREDAEYLEQLNREYERMSPDKKKEFLETMEFFKAEPEVVEKDLGNLPPKQNVNRPKKISFVTTNYSDLRVENIRKVNEFHSRDGTKVNVTIDSWLYNPYSLLKLEVKRSNFLLYYNQWLGMEINPEFTFKTVSGIIFSFYKESEIGGHLRYEVTISWPTGLIIRPVWIGTILYVKQNYLKPCRAGWKIEDEESRCFLRNGQIIVFKTNGDFDVLCNSGTKYCFYESATTPRYEVISTTGEVWEIRTKGPCRNRRKLINRNKIFMGVDPKTQETFYKREDGTRCMLWPSGRLVTTYADGTKLTSTPYFEEEEIHLDWTDEERYYIEQVVNKYKSEHSVQEPRSRTILRHSSGSKTAEAKPYEFEGFVSVSSALLMEHPKYSTVFVNPVSPFIKVTLPEHLSILIHPKGSYEVHQDKHFLRVLGSGIQFQTVCYSCNDTSTVKLNLDSSDIMCSFVDFFQKGFFALRNGEIKVKEFQEPDHERIVNDRSDSEYTLEPLLCTNGHTKSAAHNQRCFALERDLSGMEFLHQEYVALHASKLPSGTYYEHYENDSNDTGHTFSSQYSKAGYEKWVMNYEDPLSSLPVNIRKKDLKELGARQISKNLFQYPFPKNHTCGPPLQRERVKKILSPPTLIVNRTILCLSSHPEAVITEVKKYVTEYQQQASKIYKSYKEKKYEGSDREQNARYIDMRLRKIAFTLCKNSQMYPHLCTQVPSTELDIHYFGHFINKMQELKSHFQDCLGLLPNCKNIPLPLPRISNLPAIQEEAEATDED